LVSEQLLEVLNAVNCRSVLSLGIDRPFFGLAGRDVKILEVSSILLGLAFQLADALICSRQLLRFTSPALCQL